MSKPNEKQVRLFAKTIMPLLYQLQEMQERRERGEVRIIDTSNETEVPEQVYRTTVEEEATPPC